MRHTPLEEFERETQRFKRFPKLQLCIENAGKIGGVLFMAWLSFDSSPELCAKAHYSKLYKHFLCCVKRKQPNMMLLWRHGLLNWAWKISSGIGPKMISDLQVLCRTLSDADFEKLGLSLDIVAK
jgi:hypothetical protein